MGDVNIRLESLKLAHRHDRPAQQVVEHAKIYEQYLSTNGAEVETKTSDGPPSNSGQDQKVKPKRHSDKS